VKGVPLNCVDTIADHPSPAAVDVEWCGYMVSRDKADRVELVLQRMRRRGGWNRWGDSPGSGDIWDWCQTGANRQSGVLVYRAVVYGGIPVAQSTKFRLREVEQPSS
jgi:hypothetical protein